MRDSINRAEKFIERCGEETSAILGNLGQIYAREISIKALQPFINLLTFQQSAV
jgi:hypothetical protein